MRRHARMPNVPRHVLFAGSGADPFDAGRRVPPSEADSSPASAMCAPRPRVIATESGVLAPRSSYSPRLPGRGDRPTRGRAAFVPGYSCGAASASDRLPGSYVKVCPRKCAPLIHPCPKPSQGATTSRRFGPLAGRFRAPRDPESGALRRGRAAGARSRKLLTGPTRAGAPALQMAAGDSWAAGALARHRQPTEVPSRYGRKCLAPRQPGVGERWP